MPKRKHTVLVTRRIPDAGLALLRARKDLTVRIFPKDRVMTRAELRTAAKGADAMLCLLTDRIDASVLDAAGPQLKIVANYAVGYDNIDLAAAEERGVLVSNTPGALSDAVADHAVALMLATCRRIPESDRYVRAGKFVGWEPMLFMGEGLAGKTLGIIGLGRIGAGVAERMARGFGMKVLYNDVRRDTAFEKKLGAKHAPVDAILREADVVSIHVPLLPSTRHLINAKRLRLMKRTAVLVNTSRGAVIDEKALVAALKARRIAGAALDVFENEPKLTAGLAKLENVVLTPHTASATIEARSEMARIAAQAVLDALDGKVPKHLVYAHA